MIGICFLPKYVEDFDKKNLICKDHKIHIRLKSYEESEILSGFVEKLTFIVTYLLSGSISWLPEGDDPNKIIKSFACNNSEYEQLVRHICLAIDGCEGIKILPEYLKLKPEQKLGFVDKSFVPGLTRTLNSLMWEFQKSCPYSIKIKEVLFNDNIVIILNKGALINPYMYDKYLNKVERAEKKHIKPTIKSLWDEENV